MQQADAAAGVFLLLARSERAHSRAGAQKYEAAGTRESGGVPRPVLTEEVSSRPEGGEPRECTGPPTVRLRELVPRQFQSATAVVRRLRQPFARLQAADFVQRPRRCCGLPAPVYPTHRLCKKGSPHSISARPDRGLGVRLNGRTTNSE